MCQPLQNHTGSGIVRSLSQGNSGTNGVTVETLPCNSRKTPLMEEVKKVEKEIETKVEQKQTNGH